MKKPVIGITLDSQINSDKYAYSAYPWYGLRQNYSTAVIGSGGIAVMLPLEIKSIDDTLDIVDGIIITGGDFDIHPKHYGEEIISAKVTTVESRTDYEFALFHKARARQIPILGICNGMQVINVACGGSLLQHIPDQAPSNINHEQPYPKHIPTHIINISANSKLLQITGGLAKWVVNSTHHQAINQLGQGLVASAMATDGIIEAIESKIDDFIIGVEWHPEYLACGMLDNLLFKALIDQATQYRIKYQQQ